jgi:hypothetical protein
MKIRNMALRLLTILGLTSCSQGSGNKTDGQATTSLADKEVFSLYRKTESVFHVARALTTGNDNFDLHLYEVNTSTAEGAKQSFVSVEHLTRQQLDSRKSELQSSYNWTPFKGNEVLFVQIQPTGFKNETELLDKRQDIETKLSDALEKKKLGEWFAGDLGPGGGNMLYTVTDIDKSLDIILAVLKQNNLDKNALIGRRVLVAEGDWFYEVIYPTKFSGDFNTM